MLLIQFILVVQGVFAQDELFKAKESKAELATRMALTEIDPDRFKAYTPWSVSWFNWATQEVGDTNAGVGRLESYNHLSVNYRLNDYTIALRPTFFVNGAGNDFADKPADADFEMGDIYLQASSYNVALLPGDIGLAGALRWYMSTSDTAKESGRIGQLRAKMFFTKPWGNGSQTTFMLEPRYSFYSERGYIDDRGGYSVLKGNRWGELWYYIEQSKMYNSTFGLSAQTGLRHQWDYAATSNNYGEVKNRISDFWELAGYLNVNLSGVLFKVGMQQKRDIRRPNQPWYSGEKFKLFDEDETVYSIMTFVRL